MFQENNLLPGDSPMRVFPMGFVLDGSRLTHNGHEVSDWTHSVYEGGETLKACGLELRLERNNRWSVRMLATEFYDVDGAERCIREVVRMRFNEQPAEKMPTKTN